MVNNYINHFDAQNYEYIIQLTNIIITLFLFASFFDC